MLTSSKKTLGNNGELAVALYLIKNGFTILMKNFSIRGGEVDIIAQKADILTFVEVKTRTNNYFNTSEVITLSKQKKIILTAKYFISQHKYRDATYRFDVALVDGVTQKVTYLENAFCENNY